MKDSARDRQRYRTRKDILRAASRLVGEGANPTMEAVAEEALVSRATIYRYFPNIESLLYEASVDIEVPEPSDFFADHADLDPVERLDKAEAHLHELMYANENIMRHLVAGALLRGAGEEESTLPHRQNRRTPLIEAALAPIRDQFGDADWERLCTALALVFGPESMIVYRDVLPISPGKARRIKQWILRTLVEASRDPATTGD